VTGLQNVAIAVASLAAAEGAAVYVGYLAGRTAEIRTGWAEGCEWLAARRRDARAARRVSARVARVLALAVLCAVFRAHGRHRGAVSA
jgi:hypothetical protein